MKYVFLDEADFERIIQKAAAATLQAFKEQISFDAEGQPGEAANEFLTVQQTMKTLKVSMATVHNLAKSGRLKKHFVGRQCRFLRADVLAIFDRKKSK
jgi:excisionase family DNA binding protein